MRIIQCVPCLSHEWNTLSGRHPTLLLGAWVSRAIVGILVSGHGHPFECGRCFHCNDAEYVSYSGGFDPVAGFPPVGLSLSFLRS